MIAFYRRMANWRKTQLSFMFQNVSPVCKYTWCLELQRLVNQSISCQLLRIGLSLNGRTCGSLARSTPSLHPIGYMIQLTFRLKTWCKWHLLWLIFNVAAHGYLDYTTPAGWRHLVFVLCSFFNVLSVSPFTAIVLDEAVTLFLLKLQDCFVNWRSSPIITSA